jgi:hypothetical protein
MNSFVEYEYLETDALKKGIAKTIINVSPFLRAMPFQTITGNNLLYNMELTEAAAQFYQVGEQWVEGAPDWEQRSTELAILGGDADVDSFIQQTRKAQDVQAAVIELKAKAIAYAFERHAIFGRTTANADYSSAKSFKGLIRILAECESSTTTDLDAPNNTQVIAAGATNAVLTIDMLDELIDAVRPKPTHLIMNRALRRKLNSLARAAGSNLTHDKDELGYFVERYGEYPIVIDDNIPNNILDASSSVLTIASHDPTTTRANTYESSMIFAVRMGEDGLCGLTNGMIQTENIGKLETKDAVRTRIKFYCGMALFNKRAAAVLANVKFADI